VNVWLNPPEKVSFSAAEAEVTLQPPTAIPTARATPTVVTTPMPAYQVIRGGEYFSQHNRWNYCGPANLAMLLSFLGWEGDHDDVAGQVKPYITDKNVMPYELAEFARAQGYDAIVRVGGDLELIKRFINAGFPVMVEKGPHFRDIFSQITWMGHYQVLNGYDDVRDVFIAQDSFIQADYKQPYEKLIEEWRSFNYTYLVAFPPHKRNDVLNLLGEDADETSNYQRALQKAAEEVGQLEGVDLFFAYYNYGTNLVNLRDYAGAATAYDQAFALYDALPEDMALRPYRILWYQTGPYFAYFYTARYQDVIEKATRNSIEMVRDDEPALEESFYWRGKAKIAIGDREGGIEDFTTCLQYHPGFNPCLEVLHEQGIYP